jgi:hypothetical protein
VTVVDLHPDELLDKDARGELEETERERLDAHLARCATCRFERQLRLDFADDLSAEAPPVRFDHLVALEAARESARESVHSASRRRSPWRRTRTTWLLAAAALLVGSVAAATGLSTQRWRPAAPTTVSLSETVPPKRVRVTAHAAPPPVAIGTLQGSIASVPPDDAAPSANRPAVTQAVTVDRAEPRVLAVAAAPLLPEPGPVDLLDAESGARRRGDYGRVLEIHRKLEARFARSRETQVSRATVGRLMLDRGDPGSALGSFDAYLRAGSGDLGEEAMVGRATALERLGRADEALRAWGALLAAFPETPYAAHARARLGGLNGN